MSEAAAATPAPGPRTLDALIAEHNALLARNLAEIGRLRAVLEPLERTSPSLEVLAAAARVADIEVVMLDTAKLIRQAATLRALHQIREAARQAVPEPEPAPHHRGRHSVPSQRDGLKRAARAALRSVKILVPAGGFGALALKQVAAHKVTAALAACTVIGGGTAVIAHMQPERTAQYVTSTAPPSQSAGIVDADPMASPSPAALSRPGTAVRKARRITVQAPVDGPPSFPAPRVSASPSSVPPSPPAPLLTVPATPVNLGVYMTGSTEIGNPQQQAVSWSVTCGADVAVIPAQGVLEPGQQGVQLQVSLNPVDAASGAVCTFWPGGERLTVLWAGGGSASSAS
jgi:hypothetical protein